MSCAEYLVFVLTGPSKLREDICGSLASAGLTPIALHSAADYLRLPEPGLPSCLVLGVDLPDMSGAELQARIAPTGTQIVFVSERVDLPQSVRAIKAGAVDFLTTPIDPEQLLRAVRSAVNLDQCRRANRTRLCELQRRYRELTPRECEVLSLVTAGLLNKQAASLMGISPMTVQIHRGRIMRKMAARSFADLVRIADALNIGGVSADRIHREQLQSRAPVSAALQPFVKDAMPVEAQPRSSTR